MKNKKVKCEHCLRLVLESELSQDNLCPSCAIEFDAILDEDRRDLNPEDFEEDDNIANSHVEHISPKEKADNKKRVDADLKTIETKIQGDENDAD